MSKTSITKTYCQIDMLTLVLRIKGGRRQFRSSRKALGSLEAWSSHDLPLRSYIISHDDMSSPTILISCHYKITLGASVKSR